MANLTNDNKCACTEGTLCQNCKSMFNLPPKNNLNMVVLGDDTKAINRHIALIVGSGNSGTNVCISNIVNNNLQIPEINIVSKDGPSASIKEILGFDKLLTQPKIELGYIDNKRLFKSSIDKDDE